MSSSDSENEFVCTDKKLKKLLRIAIKNKCVLIWSGYDCPEEIIEFTQEYNDVDYVAFEPHSCESLYSFIDSRSSYTKTYETEYGTFTVVRHS
jgi:hypothetical protein